MKNYLTFFAIILFTPLIYGQTGPVSGTRADNSGGFLESDSAFSQARLTGGFSIHLQAILEEAVVDEVKLIIAKESFRVKLDNANLLFKGKLSVEPDKIPYLDYSIYGRTLNLEKLGRKNAAITTGQMVNAGLFAFVFRSVLNSDPDQDLSDEKDNPSLRNEPLVDSSVWLELGKTSAILIAGKTTYRLRIQSAQTRE